MSEEFKLSEWFNKIKRTPTWRIKEIIEKLNQEEEELHQVLQEHYEHLRNEARMKFYSEPSQ